MSLSIFERREVSERIIRAFLIVLIHPFFGHSPHFGQRFKDIRMLFRPVRQCNGDKFRPIICLLGDPRQATTRSKTRTTRSTDKPTSISITNASRLKSSTTWSVRNRRPQNKRSHIKSIDLQRLIVSGTTN